MRIRASGDPRRNATAAQYMPSRDAVLLPHPVIKSKNIKINISMQNKIKEPEYNVKELEKKMSEAKMFFASQTPDSHYLKKISFDAYAEIWEVMAKFALSQQQLKDIDVKGELVEFYREAVKGDYLQALEKYTNRICPSNTPSDAAEFNNWFNNQGYVCWWHKKQKKFMYTMEGVMIHGSEWYYDELFKRSITVEQLYVEFQKHKDVASTIKKQSNETT